jgi:hypothetical protein
MSRGSVGSGPSQRSWSQVGKTATYGTTLEAQLLRGEGTALSRRGLYPGTPSGDGRQIDGRPTRPTPGFGAPSTDGTSRRQSDGPTDATSLPRMLCVLVAPETRFWRSESLLRRSRTPEHLTGDNSRHSASLPEPRIVTTKMSAKPRFWAAGLETGCRKLSPSAKTA